MALPVGVDEVLRRDREVGGRRPEVVPVAGPVELQDRVGGRGRRQRGPRQRDGVLLVVGAWLRTPAGQRRVLRDLPEHLAEHPAQTPVGVCAGVCAGIGAGEHRAVGGAADGDPYVVTPGHRDRLRAGAQRDQAPVLEPAVAADPLDVQVGDVGSEVGEAPRDVGVVADHHARHAGEAEAGHVVGAVGVDGAAVQPHLHPYSRERDAQVRVVGQQRRAGGGVLAIDHPRVAAQAVAAPEPGRHPVDPSAEVGQEALGPRAPGRSLGHPAAARGGVLLEDAVDDPALVDDRAVPFEGVRRVEAGDGVGRHRLGAGDQRRQLRAVDLLGHVAAQVPGHRLEPRQRVGRHPVGRAVVAAAEVEQRVLERDLRRVVLGEVGVDTLGVGLERVAGLRLQERQLLLGHAPPTHRPHQHVGVECRLPEQLGEPAGRRVAAHVHLVEPLLRVHVALGPHQVVGGVGVDLGDPVGVAEHLDFPVEPRQLEGPAGRRQRAAHHHGSHREPGQQRQDQDHADVRRDPQRARQPEMSLPPGGPRCRPCREVVAGPRVRSCGAAHGARHCAVP